MIRRPWTRTELIAVLKLYCVTTFGRLDQRNPAIVALAKQIGRTAGAVALKMVNFAALDPTIDRRGMSNFSKLDETVWADFFGNMDAFLSNEHSPTHGFAEDAERFEFPEGIDRPTQATARSGQDFFRSMVLASYDGRCALTEIDTPDLLVAGHIVPWSNNPVARTNPRNGLLLNRLHDRAFDRGLIAFEPDLSLVFSSKLSSITREKLEVGAHTKLRLPSKFAPDMQFIAFHRENLFRP